MPPILYYLLQHTHEGYGVLHKFDSAPDRDTKTIELIFGKGIENQDEAEQWDKMREELNGKGVLTFEGDPGLEWFTAIPA